MVEGHGVRRVCIRHLKLLLNKKFKADSPNGRFTQGAKLISNQKLHRIESIGKNLFYFFGKKNSPIVVHIHFGMSGRFLNASVERSSKAHPYNQITPCIEQKRQYWRLAVGDDMQLWWS